MIVIVDYGVGNTGSISSMLNRLGAECRISDSASDIAQATKLILPGVGHFDKAVSELNRRELVPVLNQAVLEQRKPVLGICLGAQLLGRASEEGTLPGFGWLDMQVKLFTGPDLRVPHMGWNVVHPVGGELFQQTTPEEQRFYFVHSYYMACQNASDVLATSHYGSDFTCAVQRDNIYGVQFHPEKSHRFGLNLLSNFVRV
jgi:imidazole glycerol-phosphate synthase subunit HisH